MGSVGGEEGAGRAGSIPGQRRHGHHGAGEVGGGDCKPLPWSHKDAAGMIPIGLLAVALVIVIALASILGACLAAAGGARRIAEAIQRIVGERNTSLALLLAGFVLGIPMFAETVSYLLLPLARAAWERTGRGYLRRVLATLALAAVRPGV